MQNKSSDFLAKDIKSNGISGLGYTVKHPCGEFALETRLAGSFSVMNSLQAAACALEIGIDKELIASAFSDFFGVDGRFERVELPQSAGISVFVDYAHTPDAIENILKSAKGFRQTGQRLVILFGCGGDRDKTKRAKMGNIASELADLVIVTSDNSRNENPMAIIDDILCGMRENGNYVVIPDRKTAIEYAVRTALQGDIILLAGKGHERYEINAEGRRDFDERKIVIEAFEKYFGENREN